MNARGHKAFLAAAKGLDLAARAKIAGVPLIEMNLGSGFHPFQDMSDLRQLKNIIQSQSIDIVHCHRGKEHWLAATLAATGGLKQPIVRTRHVVLPLRGHVFNKWLFRNHVDKVICVSKATARSLDRLSPAIDSKVAIIYSAVDQQRFQPTRRSEEWRRARGLSPDDLLVGLIARIQSIKGQRIFFKSASLLASQFPTMRFLVSGAGKPHHFEIMSRNAARLGLEDRFLLEPWMDDIETAIASMDISVIASLGSEGSSRILYESWASGVPVIGTEVGCLPELVNGEIGALVKPGDAEALAAAINVLARDSDLRKRRAAEGLQWVKEHHTIDRWISDTVSVYETAVGQTR
ncbi:MAG: glycosyltransferase family 4 protein [Candidatus Sumerlaeaceae bacterium]|nr:glycosyltransferase family 4 protein [Candidatus Sumerlaeaceae bacterium]